MSCTLCESDIGPKNRAVLDCGHTFHLSCVLKNAQQFTVICATCDTDKGLMCDLGDDRTVAMKADLVAKCRKRQLQPVQSKTLLTHLADILSPLTPKMETFHEYTLHNKSLDLIQRMGFVPDDAIRERLPWSSLARTYAPDTLLKFGFTWEHMVKMGIRPADVSRFSWTQQIHSLQLNATKLLQLHMTISELAALQYSTHQLLELDFDWPTLTNMGGNVETWSLFRFELSDLKRYWNPTMSQWVAGGFYDKGRLQRAGWVIETVLETLPTMTQRCNGRTLRLAF
mgnify:CR=1 FL=1